MNVKEKIKSILKWTLSIIGTIFFGVTAVFYLKENRNSELAEAKKKEKENELKEKTADEIAADSPHADTISTNVKNEQAKFHDRVTSKLEGKL